MTGNKVVVLGGTGFIGRSVVNELSKSGYEISVVVRRPERFRDYMLYKNTKLVQIDSLLDSEGLKKAFMGTDVVVNLTADLTAKTEAVSEKDIVAVNQQIKKAVESAGIKRVVALSQIGADANNARNNWLYNLGESDAIMHTISCAQVTILRAGLLLGEGDEVATRFKNQLNLFPVLPVANASVAVQPLSVKDFAKALVLSIKDTTLFGKKIEVVGEERMVLKDLASLIRDMMQKDDALVIPMCSLNAKFMSFLNAFAPIRSVSKVQLSLLKSDLISDQDFSSRFGFVPMSVEQTLASYVLPTNIRERYNFYRQEAGRNEDELV
ncbi:NAD(P)H-binding protein [Hydrogenovibrio sp. 3SP14C1]|uniref:NAD(P)H-binding protein n=1 Tax=Hydrogenovibrio sp. 3SP14C1 TaxID=3038774 RepID=UPI00241654DF|nr:NAD(P)H-binding protein [Hydrogenovibrio sp. 3SP14C1]MDG4812153.1 NAD(P)H-binding protein [Hydrogenovibrio sp. 3SP14C1]